MPHYFSEVLLVAHSEAQTTNCCCIITFKSFLLSFRAQSKACSLLLIFTLPFASVLLPHIYQFCAIQHSTFHTLTSFAAKQLH